MSNTIVGAFIGIAFLVLVNIATVAYSYGRIWEQVKNLEKRVTKIENKLDSILVHVKEG